ncbi:MAG: endonuclease III [Methanomethylophilus sp.]
MSGPDVVLILDRLAAVYGQGAYPGRSPEGLSPAWPCDPFHVLIATILSQRTKDDNTRKASDTLFARFGTVQTLAAADPAEVAGLIRPAGFPQQKAKAIVACCSELCTRFGGRVPPATEELVTLPMVGRKTAACVRSYAMGLPSVCVDTHVQRIANLMGLVHTAKPEETEQALMAITPKERWSDINRYLVRHGQLTCLPRHPHCERCAVRDLCAYGREHGDDRSGPPAR